MPQIPQLQIPQMGAVSGGVDFAPLANLGNIYSKARQDEANKAAIAAFQQTGDTRALLGSGDMNLAKLGAELEQQKAAQAFRQAEAQRSQQNADRSFGFQQTEAQRAQQNADRGYGLQQSAQTRADAAQGRLDLQNPYIPDPNNPGGVIPRPGNLATDPQAQANAIAIKREAERVEREKDAAKAGLTPGTPEYRHFMATGTYKDATTGNLSEKAGEKIAEKGGAFEDFSRLKDTYKEGYGGSWTETTGDIANAVASRSGVGNKEAADWWRDYQAQKNIVRNNLFGSALTAPEKVEFDKASINPSLSDRTIKENLKLQHDATRRAAKKMVDFYTARGASSQQIEAALGMPMSALQKLTEPAAPAAGAGAGRSPDDTAAANWAAANPNDPRAAAIKQRLGIQ